MTSFKVIVCATVLLASKACAQLPKKVFGHYLVGTLNASTNHAELDVKQAKAIGFDALALDLFDFPGKYGYAQSAIDQLFYHAANYSLELFFSIDAGTQPNISVFTPVINNYTSNPQYYYQYGKPMLSTFDTGGLSPAQWNTFLNTLNKEPYFIPDFDNDSSWGATNDGNANPAFFSKWGGLRGFSGAFGWDSAWPQAGTQQNETVAKDVAVIQTAHQQNKAYMFPLSTFQNKHLNGSNYWRVGQVNMPQRMTELLALGSNLPDYVEFITLNDGGEGHYISYIWKEGNGNYSYALADHSGWQPIVTSFIQAYKSGNLASGMAPPAGSKGVGAMWYLPILTSAKCSSDPFGPPYGINSAQNAVNWAIVLPPSQSGQVRVYTAGKLISTVSIKGGLSYGSVPLLQVGAQRLEVYDSSNNLILYAASAYNVTADNVNLCDFNYEVAPVKAAGT